MSTSASVSNRQRLRAREPVSLWRENDIAVVSFTKNFCENGIVIKTSPRNVGDLVFSESRKGLSSYHEFKTTAKSLSLTNYE